MKIKTKTTKNFTKFPQNVKCQTHKSPYVAEDDYVGREEGGVDGGGAVLEWRLDLDQELRLLLLKELKDILRQGEDFSCPIYDLSIVNLYKYPLVNLIKKHNYGSI